MEQLRNKNLSCSFYLQRQEQKGDRSKLQKWKRIRAVIWAVLSNKTEAPLFCFTDKKYKKAEVMKDEFRK